MKILFFASYPDIGIGYSRIANILSNHLAEKGHEIYYVGISNFNTNKCVRYIHPNITLIDALQEEKNKGTNELYGVNVICDNIIKINPDIVFIYNDAIVISRILNNFIKNNIVKSFKLYIYLDLVYKYEKLDLINHIDKFADIIFVFSEYWKKNLIEMGINENKIDILYHGIDNKTFYPIEKNMARQQFNFKEDDFIILNTNRNSYRKCIDKTIDSFIKFLKIKNMNKNIKLFLNMNLNEGQEQQGYDIINLIKISCIKNKVDYNTVIYNNIYKYNNNTTMSDEMLNYLYNACDLGINTCCGEGFGLCNLEHGSLGKPQIISNVGGLSDIFSNEYSTLIDPITEIYVSNLLDFHGGYLEICSTDDYTNGMIKYYENPNLLEKHGNLARKILTEKYNWENILESFSNKYFQSVTNPNDNINLYYKRKNDIIDYNKINFVDHIVWINLDRCNERKKYMENILKNINIKHTRISAIDGQTDNLSKYNMINNNMSNSEIACLLSHIKAINYLATLQGDYFLILEDDIVFDNVRYFTKDLKTIITNSPDFDILIIGKYTDLNITINDEYIKYHIISESNKNNDFYNLYISGTFSYVISRKGINKIIKFAKYEENNFLIEKSISVADLFLYYNTNTVIYKYSYIATRNLDSFIHSTHLNYQTNNTLKELNIIIQNINKI
jgi:glycosyltransferase involved in cell wall biosynthesis